MSSMATFSMPVLQNPAAVNNSLQVSHDTRGDKIAETAKEFEATFVSMLIKEMRQASDSDSESGLFAGDTGDVQGGMFDLYMSKHLANNGGFGIAHNLEQQIRQASLHKDSEKPHESQLAPRTNFIPAPVPTGI